MGNQLILILIILLLCIGCAPEDSKTENSNSKTHQNSSFEFEQPLQDFVGTDWEKVKAAKDSLMNLDAKAIPQLLNLMKFYKNEVVKLKKTGDMIYPGATAYYGRGTLIPYDLDMIPVRAGWVLEELTFQNFGFVERSIKEFDFEKYHENNYDNFVHTEKHEMKFKREGYKKIDQNIRKVLNWWDNSSKNWTRFEAIKDALVSGDAERVLSAVSFFKESNLAKFVASKSDVQIHDLLYCLSQSPMNNNADVSLSLHLFIREIMELKDMAEIQFEDKTFIKIR